MRPSIASALLVDHMWSEKAASVEHFADRRVAHLDKRGLTRLATVADVDECVSLLEALFVKYYGLFTARGLVSVTPVFQYDWTAVFQEPWLPPKGVAPRADA
jgi:hypothetical protein